MLYSCPSECSRVLPLFRVAGPKVEINRLSPQWVSPREGRLEGRPPVQRSYGSPRLCGGDVKVNEMELWNWWIRVVLRIGRGDRGRWICTQRRRAQKDAQAPKTISTPAALQCWADPARSILAQLRALALGWVGGWRREQRRATSWVAEVPWRATIRREPLLASATCHAQLVCDPSLQVVYPHTSCRFRGSRPRIFSHEPYEAVNQPRMSEFGLWRCVLDVLAPSSTSRWWTESLAGSFRLYYHA